jgi:23S rRNA pseudouridine1911/1915/1917 synthase
MVVHPGAGQSHRTLAAAALAHAPQIAGIGSPRRPGIVHRLDKGTSGLLVLAKTPVAYDALTTQLAARTVTRRYRAVVDGSLGSDEGVVDAPLGRHAHDRIRMAVQAYGRGKRAVTRFRVLERGTAWTYLEAKLETGRTHQIRVHMASLGHPVYNDHLYGRGTGLRLPIDFEGLALHASDLGLVHPITQKRMEWVSPIPPRIQRLLSHLRNSS